MALTGFTSIYFAQAANHRIQLGSDPQYRGRVLALYTLILQGSTPSARSSSAGSPNSSAPAPASTSAAWSP